MSENIALRLYDWNENIVICLAIMLNGMLLYLTVTERNQTLRSYNRMICFSSAMDILYSIMLRLVSMEVILKGEIMIFISRGPLRHFPFVSATVLSFIQICTVGMETFVAPVDYFYRYALLCRKVKLSIAALIATMSLCAIPTGITAFLFCFAFWQRSSPTAQQPFEHMVREDGAVENNQTLRFSVSLASDPATLAAVLLVLVIEVACGASCVWFGYETHKQLSSMKDHISERTLRVQRKMTWLLVGKVFLPLFLISIPTSLIVISIAAHWEIPHLGTILVSIIHWIPVVSPLTTLAFITTYRRRLRNTFNRYVRPWRSVIIEDSGATSIQRAPAKSSGFSTVSRAEVRS